MEESAPAEVDLDDDDDTRGKASPDPGSSDGGGFTSLVDRLWEEYKLVQAKIDQIGDYQFKVKSWSATLLAAEIFGSKATDNFELMGCALLIAFMFHLSERRQRMLSQRLGQRAVALERAFGDLPPVADPRVWTRIQRRVPSLRSVPGVARAMMGWSEQKTAKKKNLPNGDDTKKKRRIFALLGWVAPFWHWLAIKSDDGFYVAQYLAIIGVFTLPKIYHLLPGWLKH